MNFEFATATQILFGPGRLGELGAHAARYGTRALIVTNQTSQGGNLITRSGWPVLELLAKAGVSTTIFLVEGEPKFEDALRGVQAIQAADSDLVISIGGGSAIDSGKAIAAFATNPGDPLDYVEVIGHGRSLENPPLPFIAIPTTAGTGAEVTRNAVLSSTEHKVKVSLRSPLMLPKLALVDPELTLTLSPDATARTGMDALTQVLEPFISCRANPLVDSLCREGMTRSARSLRLAYSDGGNLDARLDLCLTSLFGGLALANAGLGVVHGFAGPLGGMFNAPHGAVCAAILPVAVEVNLNALLSRSPAHPGISRFSEIACILTGNPLARPEDAALWLAELAHDLHIPPLRRYGLASMDFQEICAKAAVSSSMKGNPIPLLETELMEILTRSF